MYVTPVTRPLSPVSIDVTNELSRISAPAVTARGIHVTSALCFAFVEHPTMQKPRYTQGFACPRGAESVARGAGLQSMFMRRQPLASTRPAAFTSCARYG